MDALLVGGRAEHVAAVGLCGQANTDVFVGADGAPLAPAIAWQDNRAAPGAADLDASVTEEDRIAWWGAPLPIGASHVLARMAWMARAKPEAFAATRCVLTPKDYCLRALVGEAVADPMSNFFVVGLDLALSRSAYFARGGRA
jgi:xylulokinase